MRFQFARLAALATYTIALFHTPAASAHPRRNALTAKSHAAISHHIDVPPPTPGHFALHQRHAPRALLDVCAYIDLDVLEDLGIDLGIPLGAILDLDVCLCLSLFPLVLETDVQLAALIPLLGINKLTEILTLAINEAPGSQHCTCPDNSEPHCTKDDPCGWHCKPPYVKKDGQCVCPAPYTECNGKCGSAHRFPLRCWGCGSSVPRALAADPHTAVASLADAQLTCKSYETVCGVYGGSSRSFECLDVDTALESCITLTYFQVAAA
ncbi:hypothetical protein POSPLADRAFT_1143561 [Postia placenta MAD-698-R-SB12]|uniref:Uncharacterized protein n=1 Tax=Postia placenta MAD-698-R-SB12 TaxID=670580 RepID=A0A1X6N0H0_9APHY|nr:hypothetical protein POSPLADRAFT_1143561 [Postia placenta MAD-698-R-SB12]OSX62115.1 hypothetical protein POSPLADRAFT_1143561 [Postia placenta MAD-698-R-SB12]